MKPLPLSVSRLSLPFALAIASLIFAHSASAGTIWDGGGAATTSINLNTNWDSDVVNALGGTTTATFGTGGSTATINVAASFTGITINRDANFDIANGAGSLTVGSGGITVTLPNTTARTHTISESSLILGANQTWSVTNNTGAAQLTVSSLISGAFGITKTGSGTLSLTGATTDSGLVTVSAGVLEFTTIANGSASSLGTGSTSISPNGRIVIGNGDLKFTGTTTQTVNRNIAWEQNATGALDASGASGAALVINDNAANPFNNGGTRNFTFGGTNTDANTYSGVLNNQASSLSTVIKKGTGRWVLSGVNTYTGATTVSAGTLTLSGNRTATATGGFTVGNLAGNTGTMNISNGTFNLGTTTVVGTGANTIAGIVNQTGGNLTTAANQLLLGNGGAGTAVGSNSTGTYNLSGGTLNTVAGLGVLIGVNTGTTGVFNLSSAGTLAMAATSTMQIARSDGNAATNSTGTFSQTGGTATVGILQMSGTAAGAANNAGGNATLSLTGGTFSATTFNALSGGNNSTSAITIGGTAQVTLPVFPTNAKGTSATATITFDSTTGFLSPAAASTTYLPAGTFTNAYLTGNGAKINVPTGRDITIAEVLKDAVSPAANGTLTKSGVGTLTLSGANTYTGTTTVSAGTLSLNYSTQDNSKLSDTAALVLSGGTLDLSGGSHTEIVASTTLTANTASNITRSIPGSVLQLGAITPGIGASINFSASNIATTSTPNTNGILGNWATVGGTAWATNSASPGTGLITAVTYDVDVPRLTPGIIADGPATNIRIVEGSGFAGGITLGSAITTINSLTQSIIGGNSAATIDPSGQTLLTNAILVGSGAGALSIGNGSNNGILSTATAGGNLTLINNTANSLAINSVIADNTSASSLTQMGTGTVMLVGANTYTGATTISAGTLQIGSGGTTGSIASTSGVNNNAALVYNRSNALSVPYVISGTGTVTQVGAGTLTFTNANTYTGTTTISLGTTLQLGNGTNGNDGTIANGSSIVNNGALVYNRFGANSYGGVISGTGTVTVSGSGSQTLSATNTYSGGTTISAGGTLAASVAGAMSTGNVTNNGTLNLTGAGPITYSGLSNITPGALGGNGIVNVTLGTGSGTTVLNGDYSTFTGTWNVGIGAAAGAGKVQMNGADNAGATINLLTNATLYSNGAGIVHNAAIVLNGGDTGESIGQLRVESGAVWAGPVTLAGTITGAGDGFFGANVAGSIGTINGNIGETGGPRALSKVGTGTIILTGTNNYTGATTIGAGVLVAQGSVGAALPTTSAVNLGAATLQILNNAAGTIAQSNNITLSGSVTAGIAVGNAGGVTTGSTMAFGALNNGTTANAFGSTINFTGANGYLQSFASLALSGSTGNGTTLNPTTTSVTISGNVTNQMTGYGAVNFATLTLGGTSTGNAINGIISDATTGTPAVNSGDTRISKSGTSTWTLNGPNTYIGTTAITGGVLRITNALSLGSTTSGTTQSGSSALEIDGTGGAVVVGAETLSISGGGITNFGALRNIAGNNTYGGTVTLAAQTRINSDSGTLLLDNATAVTGTNQNLVIGGAGNITISGAITTGTGFVNRDGSGTLTLSGPNTYTGATSAAAGTISLTGSIASSNISTSGTAVFSQSGTGSIAGTGTFIQGSLGTSTLAGTNTFSGATTVSAGTLVLDYSTQDSSKLSDTAALTLGNGILDLKGGTHTETVLSTTLTANTSSRVTTSTPGSVLQMNAITPGAGAIIDFAADNIATTDTLNNASGVLGNWATVNGGTDLAMNSGSTTVGGATVPGVGVADGFIRAYTAYTDVTRRDGTPALQIIADAATSNVRIIEGTGSPANITLGAATTTISTLTQSVSGGTSAATIDSGSNSLLTNAVLVATGAGTLTIGNGTLATATSGGDLALINNSTNGLTINSVIADNTSASTLTKTGTGSLTLTAVNTFSGATSIGAGTLTLSGAGQLGSGTYAGAISSGTGSTFVYSSSVDQTLSGAISGGGSLIKDTNSSNLSLTAGNTYTGNTTVNSGTLTLAGATGVGTAGGYLYNGLASTATVTVASGAQIVISSNNAVHNALGFGPSQTWSISGTIDSTGGDAHSLPGNVILNNGTLTGVFNATFGTYIVNSAASPSTFTANGSTNTVSAANIGMNTTLTLATPLLTDALSVSSSLGVTGFLTGSLTKTGLGTATLTGASIYTGSTTVANGTLTVSGSIIGAVAGGNVIVGDTAGNNAVLNIGGNMTFNRLTAGTITGAAGAVNLSSGTVTAGADNELTFTFGAGAATGGYGYLNMTGGSISTSRFQFGGQNVAAQNGVGVGIISGGTVTATSHVILARHGTSPGTIGSLTIATGGTLIHTTANGINLGWQGAGRAELNLTGGTINNSGFNTNFGGGGATWTGTGILNLDEGTLTTTAITTQGTGATSYLNFNGGTLRAVSATTAFLPALTGVYVNGAFGSFNGGAIIDSNGVSITIAAPLIAPTGNGVATIPVTNGGSGYIGAPAVTITDSGSGFGATAIANMIDDGTGNGTLKVDSITLTNPGNNYAAPVASLVGGGNGVTAATLGTLTSVANTSGGLTKNGASYLVISGNNTYSGDTTINAGAMTLNSAIPNPNTSFVVNSGGQMYGGWGAPANTTFPNNVTISGTGFIENSVNVGAIRASNTQTFSGTITLAADSQIGMIEGGATASTFSGQITGNFALNVQGAFTGNSATQTITMANIGIANDYTGDTSVSAVDYGSVKTGAKTILRLGASSQIPNGSGNGILQLNGANTDHQTIFELNGFNETLNGVSNAAAAGAIIRNTTAGASILTIGDNDTDSIFSGVIADGGASASLALTKIGAGTVTLSGLNTYSGNTTISAGTLELADNAQLKFILGNASAVNNSISGAGAATLDGDFVIDTTAANALATGTWLLENVTTLTGGAYGANFTVVGFVDAGSDKWTKVNGVKTYTFDETTGILTLAPTPGYAGWAANNSASANLNDDHDNDGVPNGIEYFIGGPSGNTTGFTALPGVVKALDGTLSVTWTKAATYTGTYGTDFVVETSETLTGTWTTEIADPNLGFTVTFPSATEVKYTFPGGPAYSGKKFARLKVTGP